MVFFTSKDENLTKVHVKYLETRIIEIALEAGRSKLANGNSPQLPSLPRSDRDAMEEFLDPMRTLLGSLGFPLLQPVAKRSSSGDDSAGALVDIRLRFEVKKSGVNAEGASTDEGFVVFEGSLGPAKVLDTLPNGWRRLREELLVQGSLVKVGKSIKFAENVLFKSPSAAAAVVCGGNRNGREVWQNKHGTTLKQIEQQMAAPEPPLDESTPT